MPQQTFLLTGDAVHGLVLDGPHLAAVDQLPRTVCLGRKPITESHRPMMLRLESFIDKVAAVPPPPSIDWYTKAAISIARVYLNNQLGCCVMSGKGHSLGVWSANDPDSANGQTVVATDAEIKSQYVSVCGPGDNGCNIQTVLNYMVKTGFQATGQRYKLAGYAGFDWRSKELTQRAIALGGAVTIGFNLPNAWMNSSVWDLGPANFVGGHDVSGIGYGPQKAIATTKEGVIIASWGRLYLFTWDAWTSTKYIDEAYFLLPEFLWTGVDQVSPFGVDLALLKAAMAVIKGGGVPDLPDPTPVPPPNPTPDPPPVNGLNVALPGGGQLTADFVKHVVTYPKPYTGHQV